MWSIVLAICKILERPSIKSLRGGLYYVEFIYVTRITVMGIIPVHLYGIESVPSVRPPGSGLALSTFPGIMFWLRRGEKVGHGIVVIPCHHLSAFVLKGLDLPMQQGERDHGPTPW